MNQSKISRRYATALFDFALEQKQQEVVFEDMFQINRICKESHEFVRLIKSPIIKVQKKIEVLRALFSGKISSITMKYLEIIVKGRREMVIPGISEEFINIYNEFKGIKEVDVISAVALEESTKMHLIKILTQQTSKQIQIREKIQSSLIGGFILKMDNQQFDSSIQSRLNKLKIELSQKY